MSSGHDASEHARIQGPIIFTWALAIIACTLRFVARRISEAGLWYDDWLMIPALVYTSHKLLSPIG